MFADLIWSRLAMHLGMLTDFFRERRFFQNRSGGVRMEKTGNT